MLRPPPPTPLFPYTTLFRSRRAGHARGIADVLDGRAMATFLGGNIRGAVIAFDRVARLKAMTAPRMRSEEHTSELQSQSNLVCRLLLEKKKQKIAHRCTTWL